MPKDAAKVWEEEAPGHGLPKDGLMRTFSAGGKAYTVTGIDPRKAKFPVEVVDADGNVGWFRAEVVRRALLDKPPAPPAQPPAEARSERPRLYLVPPPGFEK